MHPDTLPLLCNPFTGEPFKLENDQLVGVASAQSFPIINGIPSILDAGRLHPRSRWHQWLYNQTAFAYDSILHWSDRLKISSDLAVMAHYLPQLDIKPGDKVFESALGTASSIPHLPLHADYYGQDLSWRMLARAQKKCRLWDREIELFHGDGAYIPFRDNTFDTAFQIGALQFFGDTFKTVSELARVVKPGNQVHILDEVNGAVRTLKRMPAHAKYAKNKDTAVPAMARLVPHSMQHITTQVLPGGDFYALSFTKPPTF